MEQSKFYQIKNITEQEYTLVGCDGSVIALPIQDVDKSASAFTIQDAKDGDVLCTYECGEPKIIFILKGVPKKHYALSYHCYYNIMYPHFESDSEKGCLAPNDEDVKPATKEQRDLLFQKMKEAGYEWNAETLELKKIEPKKEDTSELTPFEAELFSMMSDAWQGYLFGEEVNIAKIVKEHSSELLERANEQNPWSEEDEMFVHGLIRGLAAKKDIHGHITFSSDCIDITETINWLKSLKNRVQSQPKQEWSEEDKNMLQSILDEYKSMPIEKRNWLKSLRPQKHWKPSDVELIILDDVIKNAHLSNANQTILKKLHYELKKLTE